MKTWMVNNKGITIILIMLMMVLVVAVVAGPSIWAAILSAHGF